MKLRRDDVVVGVGTHKDEHVAVLVDGFGGRLGELFIPATLAGFAALLSLQTFSPSWPSAAGRGRGERSWLRRVGHRVIGLDAMRSWGGRARGVLA